MPRDIKFMPKHFLKRLVSRNTVRLSCALCIVLVLLLFIDVHRYLYPGAWRTLIAKERSSPPPGTQELRVITDDGVNLRVWQRQQAHPDAPLVVLCGGDDGDVRYQVGLSDYFFQHGFSVLSFDYRGFGGSSGFPTQAGIEKDITAVMKLAAHVPESKRFVFGISFGTYPALYAATQLPIAKLILVAPFVDFPSVDRNFYQYPWLVDMVWPHYSNEALLHKLMGTPDIKIFYGLDDVLIPPWHALQLEQNIRSLGQNVSAQGIPQATHRTLFSQMVQQGVLYQK
jgi:hypothetical protein